MKPDQIRELCEKFDHNSETVMLDPYPMYEAFRQHCPIDRSAQYNGSISSPVTPDESSLDRYAIIGNLFVPNASMVLHPHHIEFWTIYQNPNDVGACRVHLRYLTPQAEHDEKGVERLDKNWKIATDAIINEDVPVGNGIQASANMAHAGRACLGRNEVTNQLFHRAWREYMEAP